MKPSEQAVVPRIPYGEGLQWIDRLTVEEERLMQLHKALCDTEPFGLKDLKGCPICVMFDNLQQLHLAMRVEWQRAHNIQ